MPVKLLLLDNHNMLCKNFTAGSTDLKLKEHGSQWHTLMNALLQKSGCKLKEIVAGQQLASKIFTEDENKVSFFGKERRCKCLTLGGGDETW